MSILKNIIYLSNEDYATLLSTGSVVIDGTTLTYDENNLYITPEETASALKDGLMSAEDKTKLDGLATVAETGSYNDLKDKPTNYETLIVGQYNSPNYYQNDLSADIEAGTTKPIFEVAIGTSEEDKQNAFTTYADGQTYWRKPNFFRDYTEFWETRFRYLTYFMDSVQMDANLRVSGTLEVNNGVQFQGSVAAYGLMDARGGLNTTNIAANSVYATTSMQTPYLDAATTYVNYIYRKTDQVDGSIGTIQYPFGLVAAKNVYIANIPTDEHHAATKNYVDSRTAEDILLEDDWYITSGSLTWKHDLTVPQFKDYTAWTGSFTIYLPVGLQEGHISSQMYTNNNGSLEYVGSSEFDMYHKYNTVKTAIEELRENEPGGAIPSDLSVNTLEIGGNGIKATGITNGFTAEVTENILPTAAAVVGYVDGAISTRAEKEHTHNARNISFDNPDIQKDPWYESGPNTYLYYKDGTKFDGYCCFKDTQTSETRYLQISEEDVFNIDGSYLYSGFYYDIDSEGNLYIVSGGSVTIYYDAYDSTVQESLAKAVSKLNNKANILQVVTERQTPTVIEVCNQLVEKFNSSMCLLELRGYASGMCLVNIATYGGTFGKCQVFNLTDGRIFETVSDLSQIPIGDAFYNGDKIITESALSNKADSDHTHDDKQDTLVSGTNIKTVNGQSLLGSGNIVISGGDGSPMYRHMIYGAVKVDNNYQTLCLIAINRDPLPLNTNATTKLNISSTTYWRDSYILGGYYNETPIIGFQSSGGGIVGFITVTTGGVKGILDCSSWIWDTGADTVTEI